MSKVFVPWNSIAEGLVRRDPVMVTFEQALGSPCTDCATSPCCTHLPLHTFSVTSLMELDHARYLLNFDHIELGLAPTGDWSVYYRYPCRFLDREHFTCRVHRTPDQPDICVNYNPHACWYRRVLTQPVSEDFLRIDRQRLDHLVRTLSFDGDGRIVGVPEWSALLESVAALPLLPAPPAPEAPGPDPATTRWRAEALAGSAVTPAEPVGRTFAELGSPCSGCAAYCCTALVFPYAVPATRSGLDHLRFSLGFPGIEVGIADDGWSLIVRTRCRHLDAGRCTVYGSAERPLLCTYYDAAQCSYTRQFAPPRPEGFVRLRLEEWPALAECFRFDDFGTTLEVLAADAIREHVEVRWRSGA